jgi:hypothetical protein
VAGEGGVSRGVLRIWRLGASAEGVEDVGIVSDDRPRTQEGILVIRRNREVLIDSSRPGG